MIKKLIRRLLLIRDHEKISDGIDRHKVKIKKIVNRKEISEEALFNALESLGITTGDTVMVHASWRHFYAYDGSPQSFINKLYNLVGPTGTILMPSFGDNLEYFDVKNTPSRAGVLSEVFRNYKGVIRSECSHFSVSGIGQEAEKILNTHKYSEFGFDYNSPYYLITQIPNVKIINLGMGKYPIKTTLVHCVEYPFRQKDKFFRDYIKIRYKAKIITSEGRSVERDMIKGVPARLSKTNIKKFYKTLPSNSTKYTKVGNIDIRLIIADHAYNHLINLTTNGVHMVSPINETNKNFRSWK